MTFENQPPVYFTHRATLILPLSRLLVCPVFPILSLTVPHQRRSQQLLELQRQQDTGVLLHTHLTPLPKGTDHFLHSPTQTHSTAVAILGKISMERYLKKFCFIPSAVTTHCVHYSLQRLADHGGVGSLLLVLIVRGGEKSSERPRQRVMATLPSGPHTCWYWRRRVHEKGANLKSHVILPCRVYSVE